MELRFEYEFENQLDNIIILKYLFAVFLILICVPKKKANFGRNVTISATSSMMALISFYSCNIIVTMTSIILYYNTSKYQISLSKTHERKN